LQRGRLSAATLVQPVAPAADASLEGPVEHQRRNRTPKDSAGV